MKKIIILKILVTLLNSDLTEDELFNHIQILRNMINYFFKDDKLLINNINSSLTSIKNINERNEIYKNIINMINKN